MNSRDRIFFLISIILLWLAVPIYIGTYQADKLLSELKERYQSTLLLEISEAQLPYFINLKSEKVGIQKNADKPHNYIISVMNPNRNTLLSLINNGADFYAIDKQIENIRHLMKNLYNSSFLSFCDQSTQYSQSKEIKNFLADIMYEKQSPTYKRLHNIDHITAFKLDLYRPFMEDAMQESVEVLQLLLNAGMNINNQNESGETLLHIASQEGNFLLVKFLLEHGIDKNLKSTSGQTAMQMAEQEKYYSIVAYLNENHHD